MGVSKTIHDGVFSGDPLRQHGSFLPYSRLTAARLTSTDSINQGLTLNKEGIGQWLNPLEIPGEGFYISAVPAVAFIASTGAATINDTTTVDANGVGGGVGFQLMGGIGKKLAFAFGAHAVTEVIPEYQSQIQESTGSLPGWGQSNPVGNVFTTTLNSWNVSYRPVRPFEVSIGNGRHFVGNGYRSLILSDYGANYPYLRLQTNVGRFQYTNLYNWQRERRLDGGFNEKYTAMHHLSWNVARWLNIGAFETVVWQGKDSTFNRGFDFHYVNPIIFHRPLEFSTGSSDNSLIGVDFNLHSRKLSLYGQLMLDEFLLKEVQADFKHWLNPDDTTIQAGWWANKYGVQIGLQAKDIIDYFSGRVEFNMVRPYMYSHGSVTQNYAHLGLPLAHPLGANFKETLLQIAYHKGRWKADLTVMVANVGRDSANVFFGSDLGQSYVDRNDTYGNFIGQGVSTDITTLRLGGEFLLLPQADVKFFGRVIYRVEDGIRQSNEWNFAIGLRSSLLHREEVY